MSHVVTARVPAGIRERGVDVLREIGSNTSELINAAFAYVIQTHELPVSPRNHANDGQATILDEVQRAHLQQVMGTMKVPTPAGWNDVSFEDLFDQAMEYRYANLR